MSFGLIFIFIFVFLVLYPVTLIRSRRSNSTCSMMVINKKNSMLVKIMCCGEEITNQINCLFLFYFWCGRKKVKREKRLDFSDFSVRKYLDHHDRKFFVVVEREILCFLYFYFYGGTRHKKTWERGSVGWPAAASVSSG